MRRTLSESCRLWTGAALWFVLMAAGPEVDRLTLHAQEIERSEYSARQARLFDALADGIVVLHARSSPNTMEQWGFMQDPSFLYFTGLSELPSAILALDGPRREVRLFVPPPPISFGMAVSDLVPMSREGLSMITSSFGPGTAPSLQLAGSFHSPLYGEVQKTASATRNVQTKSVAR